MKTLSQVRAANALRCRDINTKTKEEGDIINKLPAYIQNNGLIATLAFCMDKSKKKGKESDNKQDDKQENGYAEVANIIIDHLKTPEINIVNASDLEDLIKKLANGDANLLRRATAETLALLNYMKRFEKQDL